MIMIVVGLDINIFGDTYGIPAFFVEDKVGKIRSIDFT